MMKKECSCCGIEIKKTSRTLPTCKCGSVLCWKCAGLKCKDCLIIADDKSMIYDYLKDKYMSKVKPVITSMMFILLLSIIVVAQVSISDVYVKKDCLITSVPYTETVIDGYDEVYHSKNDTTESIPIFKDITKYYDVYDCSPRYIEVN